ncbi:MAG: DHH family phosphoesterase, partial [Spirochaetia bacterium]
MLEPHIPDSLVRCLTNAESVLVISHKEPDGDCIGSSLAAGSAFRRMGKTVDYFNVGPFDRGEIKAYASRFKAKIPETLRSRPGTVALILDCSTSERIGELEHQLGDIPVCVIDHHAGGDPFGDHRWIVSESPSTTYLVL